MSFFPSHSGFDWGYGYGHGHGHGYGHHEGGIVNNLIVRVNDERGRYRFYERRHGGGRSRSRSSSSESSKSSRSSKRSSKGSNR